MPLIDINVQLYVLFRSVGFKLYQKRRRSLVFLKVS